MSVMTLIEQGGPIMWPLFLVAVLAAYLIIYKTIQILNLHIRYRKKQKIDQIRDLLKNENYEEAKSILHYNGPIEKILRKGIDYLEGGFTKEAMKDRLEMIYEEELHRLERGLSIILILGEIMPMLGLLGTVSGMIHVFKAITAHGAGEVQALAGGISEALLTTEVGLVLAIPTMFCYTLLNSELDALSKLMRHSGSALVTISRVTHKSL